MNAKHFGFRLQRRPNRQKRQGIPPRGAPPEALL
jgi:hypothetical protein